MVRALLVKASGPLMVGLAEMWKKEAWAAHTVAKVQGPMPGRNGNVY
jgi:hypothetical protein